MFETFAHNPLRGSSETVFSHPSLNSYIQIDNFNQQWDTWQVRQAWPHKQTLGAWRADTKTPLTYCRRLGAGRHISTGCQQRAMRPGNLLYLLLYLPIIGRFNWTMKCPLKNFFFLLLVFRFQGMQWTTENNIQWSERVANSWGKRTSLASGLFHGLPSEMWSDAEKQQQQEAQVLRLKNGAQPV